MGGVQGRVWGYQVALADEVVLLERDRTEVDVDGVQDVPKALAMPAAWLTNSVATRSSSTVSSPAC
jgi:hypothetical protein